MYGGEQGAAERIALGKAAGERYASTEVVDYVAAQHANDPAAAMPIPMDFYENPDRGGIPEWHNRFAVMSWPEWLNLDSIALAPRLRVPTLLVHSEDAAIPDGARRFHAGLGGDQAIVWTEGSQFRFLRPANGRRSCGRSRRRPLRALRLTPSGSGSRQVAGTSARRPLCQGVHHRLERRACATRCGAERRNPRPTTLAPSRCAVPAAHLPELTETSGNTTRHSNGGESMLGDHHIQVVLLATDLQTSKDFYAQKVGLDVVSENENAVTFKCGGTTRLTVSASTTGTADEQTQASWLVEDLASELAELRSRGVEIIEIDTPELRTENGIVDTGDALHAWFVDPAKNTLGIDQYK